MSTGAQGLCVAFITAPSKVVAQRLAKALIGEHLAACVNILGPAESVYWWQGKVERAKELLMIVKLTRRRVAAVRALLSRAHPYAVPELVVMPVVDGLPSYLEWIHASCRADR